MAATENLGKRYLVENAPLPQGVEPTEAIEQSFSRNPQLARAAEIVNQIESGAFETNPELKAAKLREVYTQVFPVFDRLAVTYAVQRQPTRVLEIDYALAYTLISEYLASRVSTFHVGDEEGLIPPLNEWKVNAGFYPFTVRELITTTDNVTQQLLAIELDTPEKLENAINQLSQAIQEAQATTQDLAQQPVESSDPDRVKENKQKAAWLQEQPIDKAKDLLLKLSILSIPQKAPSIGVLSKEIPNTADPSAFKDPEPTGKSSQETFTAWKASLNDLAMRLEDARQQRDAFTYPPSIEAELRSHIDQLIAQGEAELKRRQDLAFNFWKSNAENIHPSLGKLRQVTEAQTSAGIGTDPQSQQAELDKALRDATAEISAADLPTETEKRYTTFLDVSYWNPQKAIVSGVESAVAANKSAESIQRSLREISEELARVERTVLEINVERDFVTLEFQSIYTNLEKIRQNISPDNTALLEAHRKLEIQVLHTEYRQRRQAYHQRMMTTENTNANIIPLLTVVFDGFIFGGQRRILGRLEQLKDPEFNRYQADYEASASEYNDRKFLHLSWQHLRAAIHGEGERKPIGNLSDDQFPLSGKGVENLIRHGLKETEWGNITNVELGRATRQMIDWDNPGMTKEVSFQETAVGYCMRWFDKIYEGHVPDAVMPNGERISTKNIHTSAESMIEYVHHKLVHEVEHRVGKDIAEKIPSNLVTRAFRVHLMFTMNHSYLAKESASITDYLYYLFNWLEYCVNYSIAGTNNFSPVPTLLLFGFKGENPMESIYEGPEDLRKIEKALERKKLLGDENYQDPERKEAKGFHTYAFLYQGALFKLSNVAQGTERAPDGSIKPKVKVPIFEPPMRYFPIYQRDAQGNSTTKAKRFAQADPNAMGRIITLDDVQSVDGERLYESELFDWESIGFQMIEYYNQLAKNGMEFLNRILKLDEKAFVKAMEDPDTVSSLKNQDKYSMTLFPVVGNNIRLTGEKGPYNKELANEVMNKVVIMLIYSACLIMTSTTKEEFWDVQRVKDYLYSLAEKGAIDFEDAEAIQTAVLSVRKWPMRGMSLLQRLRKQITEAARFR